MSGNLYEQMMANRAKFGTGDLSNLHGSAKLTSNVGHDLSPLFSPYGSTAIPLGRDQSNPETGATWDLTKLQGHGITFGYTRNGKGVNAIIPALLSYAGSMVVIDPKGENAWITAERRRAMGQRVVILDPWGEVNRRYAGGEAVETVTNYNPLASLDVNDPDFPDDMAGIADAMIIGRNAGNPHWDDSARDLFAGLATYEAMMNPGKASMRSVRRNLVKSAKALSGLAEAVQKEHPGTLAAEKLARFTDETDEIGSIRSTAMTQTVFLDSPQLTAAMETGAPPFDLSEIASGKVTVYLVLPINKLQTHGRWLRLFLTLAISAIAKQATPPALPVLFVLDEMGTVGPLQVIEQAFGLMAGIGIRIWGFLQDLTQLRRDYPQSWETFISNASVIQALGVGDPTTSGYVSNLLGTYTIERLSYESAQARKAEKGLVSLGDQAHGRPLLLPQEIRDGIPSTQALTRIAGGPNLLLNRMPYYAESGWYDFYRAPPQHPKPPRAVPVVEAPKKGWGKLFS